MKLIKLTSSAYGAIYINADNMLGLRADNDGETEVYLSSASSSPHSIYVKETVDEIIGRIDCEVC